MSNIFSVYYTEVIIGGKRQSSVVVAYPGESLKEAIKFVGWQQVEDTDVFGPMSADMDSIDKKGVRCAVVAVKKLTHRLKGLRRMLNEFLSGVVEIKERRFETKKEET